MATRDLANVPLRARFEVRSLLGQHPAYIPWLRWKRRRIGLDDVAYWDMGLVDRSTELLIDAFWRSGNTFALAAFKLAQDREIRIAHHACSPGQVKLAARLNIPTLVIAREPRDTIVSSAIWSPSYTVSQWTRVYARYYEGLACVPEGPLVAMFEEVTGDFGAVIEQINRRWGACFGVFDHTQENVDRAFESLDANDRLRFATVNEAQVSRPSPSRQAEKQRLQEIYGSPSLAAQRQRAEAAYMRFIERAGRS